MEKVLLVIGASSDIGTGAISDLLEDYDMIIAHYNHMNENLERLTQLCGDKLICFQADLSEEIQIKKLIGNIKETGLPITHILHLPAPQCTNSKFHKITWDVFENELNISLKSLILLAQEFLPKMAKAHYGKLVIMLSFVLNGMPPGYCSNYVVAKYALLGLMKSLAVEYADKGITVNGISPAWIMTKYINNQPEFLIEENARKSPIGRNLFVSDIVPTIKYLFSDGADCVNGQNISITCGR